MAATVASLASASRENTSLEAHFFLEGSLGGCLAQELNSKYQDQYSCSHQARVCSPKDDVKPENFKPVVRLG